MKLKLLLTMFVLVGLLSVGVVLAEDGTTQVTILNTAPSAGTPQLNDAVTGDEVMTLTANATTTITCFGTASDADGLTDITGVSGVIWSANSAYGSADAEPNHYSDADCGYNSGDGSYSCSFDVQFYADAALWTCNVTATDNAADTGSATDTATMNQLMALDIPNNTDIDFGSLSVGQSAEGGSLNVVFENQGNVAFDVDVDAWETAGNSNSANSFSCTSGNIGIGQLKADLVDQASYAAYTYTMTTSGYVTVDASLAQQTSGSTPTSDTLYFGLQIPGSVSGTCTGVFSLQATADV
ncbi:hypothetical protein JXA48_02945 [Candidatus Woesearchaeota archaeon]|nr:hypothetical protein [Candidatus Woesearchaeota archaeon]